MAGLILLLVFVAGYAVQRGSTCAVAGVVELVTERRPERFLGFFTSGAVALSVIAISSLLGHNMIGHYRGANVLMPPIIGGMIFGTGAFLNGACAFGTVARLGQGDTARIGTLAGILGGFDLASRLGLQSPQKSIPSPLLGLPAAIVLLLGGGVVVLIWASTRRASRAAPSVAGWNPLSALVLIGLINGVLLILSPGWPYTNLLMDLAKSAGAALAWRSLMTLVFIAGAIGGAIAVRNFRPSLGSAGKWARCIAAGLFMGVGATLVPGGNDTMLLIGLPLILPSFILAYAAMVATMALIIVVNSARSGSTVSPA